MVARNVCLPRRRRTYRWTLLRRMKVVGGIGNKGARSPVLLWIFCGAWSDRRRWYIQQLQTRTWNKVLGHAVREGNFVAHLVAKMGVRHIVVLNLPPVRLSFILEAASIRVFISHSNSSNGFGSWTSNFFSKVVDDTYDFEKKIRSHQ